MPITAGSDSSSAAPSGRAADDAAGAGGAAWIEKLQGAVEAASAEARGAFFYYVGFGLYFAIAVAGTSHEDLLRGSTVTMPGLGIGMPIVGFYLFVPLLFLVFHVYALLQLVILARRIGSLKLAMKRRPGSAAASGQDVLLSPFAISQRLFGEPRGLVPRTVLCVAIWLTLVLIPLALLLATQLRFLPYHAVAVTWAHRLYIALDLVLLWLLWPEIIYPARRSTLGWLSTVSRRAAGDRLGLVARARAGAEAVRRRLVRWRGAGAVPGHPWLSTARTLGALMRGGLALLVLFIAFVVATIPGEALEHAWLTESGHGDRAACSSLWRLGWLDTVRLPDRREVLCVTYALFESPETPLGLRRNLVVTEASLVVVEPSQEQIDELGPQEAWRSKGKGVDLQGRDLRFADLSGSDLRRADLRGANLQGALLRQAKLTAARAGDIAPAEVGTCVHEPDTGSNTCLTGLVDADLTAADLRFLEGWKVDFQGADLTAARLEDAELEHGQLDGALLAWAHLDRAKLDGASLTGAVLREATAPAARLNAADLDYAFLRQADLAGAELRGIRLKRADLGKIEFPPEPGWRRNLSYETTLPVGVPADPLAPKAEQEITASLFARACLKDKDTEEETGKEKAAAARSAHGVVQRLWHEFDYSKSHDEEGYARVADLRYLLARLMLSPERCAGTDQMREPDVAQLQRLLSEWCAWKDGREEPDKPLEPDLESWKELSARLPATGQAAGTNAATVPDIWQRLDAETSVQRSCPELRVARASGE